MPRELLPNRRANFSFTIEFQGERYDVTIGHYRDGRAGEVFINRILGKASAKVGTLLDGVCRDSAILMSIAIQFGTDLSTLSSAITRDEDGAPSTIVGAIVDYLSTQGSPYDGHNDNPRRKPDPSPVDPNGPPIPISPTWGYTVEPNDEHITLTPLVGTTVQTPTPERITTGSERVWQDVSDRYYDSGGD